MDNTWLLNILVSAFVFLLSGNIYFLKKTLDKVESDGAKGAAALLAFTEQQKTLTRIESELRKLRRLEKEVAGLKGALKAQMKKNREPVKRAVDESS